MISLRHLDTWEEGGREGEGRGEGGKTSNSARNSKSNRAWTHGWQEEEELRLKCGHKALVRMFDRLKVVGGVNLLQQLRELRLQHIHLSCMQCVGWNSLAC